VAPQRRGSTCGSPMSERLTGLLVEARSVRADLRAGVARRRPDTAAHFAPLAASCSMLPGIVRPRSRGHLRITGPGPLDRIEIVTNTFSDPADMKAMIRSVGLWRELGNSAAMSPFVKHEIMPGNLETSKNLGERGMI
jgi:choline dehydrogenase-like flavoprotein